MRKAPMVSTGEKGKVRRGLSSWRKSLYMLTPVPQPGTKGQTSLAPAWEVHITAIDVWPQLPRAPNNALVLGLRTHTDVKVRLSRQDLSFAGWVFLMEPLEDASLEAQVVARAHRMGAPRTRPIRVETLVMQARCGALQNAWSQPKVILPAEGTIPSSGLGGSRAMLPHSFLLANLLDLHSGSHKS